MDTEETELLRYFRKISQILLSTASAQEDQAVALRALHSILARVSGIHGALSVRSEGFETKLRSGFALSPGYAADCLLDTVRTVRYVQALDLAIRRMKSDFPGQSIDILYAGTGPFAPFAVAVTENFRADEIQFTALDIHQESLDALGRVVSALGLDPYFRRYVRCDATEYTAETPPHIVITETMHRAVSREPHAAITLNLAPQLKEGGVFIPERVSVSASMSVTEKEVAYLEGALGEDEIRDVRIDMGTIFELSRNVSYEYTTDRSALVCSTITIPENLGDNQELVLSTQVQLFGPICIREKESGITHPFFAREIGKLAAGDKVQFLFELVGHPRLTCRKVEDGSKAILLQLEQITPPL